jgi:cupin 2 domain-containing protein
MPQSPPENGHTPPLANLFAGLPAAPAAAEQFAELLARPGLRIERIVSTGQSSPPDFWYDQAEGEWVLILQGEAKLRFADEVTARHLKTGDFVDIAPHRQHRIVWTPADQTTLWLVVFYAPQTTEHPE